MKQTIIRGILCGIFVPVILLLWAVCDFWIVDFPYYISHIVSILLIGLTAFILKSDSLKHYGISVSIAVLTLLFVQIVFIFSDIHRYAFKLIFGADTELGAGDGFAIMVSVIKPFIVMLCGTAVSFILTLVKIKRKKP